jgi:hypothetical protein
MLQLNDGGLACLVRAARTVPWRERRRWLKNLADRIDPAPRSAASERKARLRARVAAGRCVLAVEVSEHDLAAALITASRLSEADALDRGKLTEAAAALLREWSERWTSHR